MKPFQKHLKTLLLVAFLFPLFSLPLFSDDEASDDATEHISLDKRDLHKGRGNPWEYDAGPAKDSEWLKLFSQTPNFRGIGKAILGFDRFRWHWGPVFYRGRLQPNQVKVLVIGQEGAQDEALSNRSFTGGTGGKMQHFLNYIGINRSYLFLNTFIYCIFGQYQDHEIEKAPEGDYWMGQNLNSPIVRHRNKLFNHVAETNDLRLVIAVGAAAKDSLVTWITSRGGRCENKENVQTCDASILGEQVKLLAVPHPGGAGQAETEEERDDILKRLRNKFQEAANLVARWIENDPDWLPKDEDAHRSKVVRTANEGFHFSDPYQYYSDPVPYRDFSYGTNWRLGKAGTTSNRLDNQRSIKIFSDKGKYADPTVKWKTPLGSSQKTSGYVEIAGDFPYEPPRVDYNAFDPGPGEKWAKLFMGGEERFEWPDFNKLSVTEHYSFGWGSIYRGRPDEARVLILADQESHDDMFTGRALSGDGGQKLQLFLKKAGISHSYVIIRTLPVDTLDLSDKKVEAISQDPQVRKVRSEILQDLLSEKGGRLKTELILTVGPHAATAIADVNVKNIPVINLKAADEDKAYRNWNQALKTLSKIDYAKDLRASFDDLYDADSFDESRLEINRYDLPFHTRRWVGTSGSLATRSLNNYEHYKFTMPLWASKLSPAKLSSGEKTSLIRDGWLK